MNDIGLIIISSIIALAGTACSILGIKRIREAQRLFEDARQYRRSWNPCRMKDGIEEWWISPCSIHFQVDPECQTCMMGKWEPHTLLEEQMRRRRMEPKPVSTDAG